MSGQQVPTAGDNSTYRPGTQDKPVGEQQSQHQDRTDPDGPRVGIVECDSGIGLGNPRRVTPRREVSEVRFRGIEEIDGKLPGCFLARFQLIESGLLQVSDFDD